MLLSRVIVLVPIYILSDRPALSECQWWLSRCYQCHGRLSCFYLLSWVAVSVLLTLTVIEHSLGFSFCHGPLLYSQLL